MVCSPNVDTVCPWPQMQDESYGRPFNFLLCSPGQNNNCSSGWTCQVSRRSRQNQECSTEANKAATISCPSIKWLREREIQTEKEGSFKWYRKSVEPASTGSILQMAKVLCIWRSPVSLLKQISKNKATLINVSCESLAGRDPNASSSDGSLLNNSFQMVELAFS